MDLVPATHKGKGRLYIGFSNQDYHFTRYNGASLNALNILYQGGQSSAILTSAGGSALETVPATFGLGMDVRLSQNIAFLTYGVTDRFDVSIGLPVVHSAVAARTYNGIIFAGNGFGTHNLSVDGRSVDLSKTLAYKGVMLSGVPNLASVFGYINASWTLKADLICTYVCRLLNRMDKKGVRQVTPQSRGETAAAPFVEKLTPGYMERALADWPKQGSKAPWRVYQNYIRDAISLKWSPVDNNALEFSNPPVAPAKPSVSYS